MNQSMGIGRTLSAQEAIRLLDIRKETLYAYVSRGRVRSEVSGENGRERRYLAEDVRQLCERKSIRRAPGQAGVRAFHHGLPILTTHLSRIADEQVFLRDIPLVELAVKASFEETCGLLWLNDRKSGQKLFDQARSSFSIKPAPHAADPLDAFQVLLVRLQTDDPTRHYRTPQAVAECGARMIWAFAHLIIKKQPSVKKGISLAGFMSATLAPEFPSKQAIRIVNAMLVLCVEHELNTSSFTARCVASTGASSYAAVNAGLCALRGPRHGGATLLVEQLLTQATALDDGSAVVAAYLGRGEAMPGFGHRIYRGTDPRAAALFRLLKSLPQARREMRLAGEVIRAMELGTGLAPNLDLALVVACRALKAPPGAALNLFCLSRVAGFVAHAIEQYGDGRLLRPRAGYEK